LRLLQIFAAFFNSFEERRLAEQRAYDLLASHLTAGQNAQFTTLGRFDVIGSDTNRLYIIRNATTMNIDELDCRGQCIKRWCFGPKGNLPQGDVLLAQKLALECFESAALAEARAFTPDGLYIAELRCRT
jgi:hypothetical protein